MNARYSNLAVSALLATLAGIAAGCSSQGSADPAPAAATIQEALGATPYGTGSTCSADCLGGACVAGQCQPIQLAGGQSRPWFLTVDGTDVYFTAATFYQVNKASLVGGPITTIASGSVAYAPTGIVVTGGYVIYASESGGKIWRAAPGANQPDPVAIATGQNMPVDLATDGRFVYWANYGDGTIARVHVRPLAGEAPEVIATGQNHPEEVAVRGDYVYWTASGGGTGAIARKKLAAGSLLEPLASGTNPAALAVDDSYVYWVDSGAGTVNRVPVGGGQVTPIATGQSQPLGIVVDANNVYWSSYNGGTPTGGTISRANLDGTNATVIATGQRRPYSMAQDVTAVYWVNDGWEMTCAISPCGAVMKLAK